MRVIKEGVLLTLSTQNITAATNANPCVLTVNAHGYSDGDGSVRGVGGGDDGTQWSEFQGGQRDNQHLFAQTPDGIELDSSAYGSYGSGGTVAKVYELPRRFYQRHLRRAVRPKR